MHAHESHAEAPRGAVGKSIHYVSEILTTTSAAWVWFHEGAHIIEKCANAAEAAVHWLGLIAGS